MVIAAIPGGFFPGGNMKDNNSGIGVPLKDDIHPVAKKVDEHNERLERSHEDDISYISKDFAKSIWFHYREKIIDLGGRNKR